MPLCIQVCCSSAVFCCLPRDRAVGRNRGISGRQSFVHSLAAADPRSSLAHPDFNYQRVYQMGRN